MYEVWWVMAEGWWTQSSLYVDIYGHPPIRFFVDWVGGCLFVRVSRDGSGRRHDRSQQWCPWRSLIQRVCHLPSEWRWCFGHRLVWPILLVGGFCHFLHLLFGSEDFFIYLCQRNRGEGVYYLILSTKHKWWLIIRNALKLNLLGCEARKFGVGCGNLLAKTHDLRTEKGCQDCSFIIVLQKLNNEK